MATRSEYDPVTAALADAGFHFHLRDYGDGDWSLVCVTSRSPEGELCGPSFWLVRVPGGRWCVAEWGGHPAFLLPAGTEPAAVCVACLRGMGKCTRIPGQVVAGYGLVPLELSEAVNLGLTETDGDA
jgi:hypothetical protein